MYHFGRRLTRDLALLTSVLSDQLVIPCCARSRRRVRVPVCVEDTGALERSELPVYQLIVHRRMERWMGGRKVGIHA